MRRESWLLRLIAGAVASGMCLAQAWAGEYRAPRTRDGVPDLGGTWTNAWLTKLERAKEFTTFTIPEKEAAEFDRKNANKVVLPKDPVGQADSEFAEAGEALARIRGTARTSWIYQPADGMIPYTAAARKANKERREADETVFDNPEQRPLGERCMGVTQTGPPMRNDPDLNLYEIVQTRDEIAIVSESNQAVRVVRLGGEHGPKAVRQWMGDSIGHWEGDTLVVETVGFHPRQVRAPDNDASADTKVIERFTRTSPTQIHYAFTVENPALYTQRWRGEMIFRPANGQLYEYACHEGNYGFANILAGARQVEQEAAAKATTTAAAGP